MHRWGDEDFDWKALDSAITDLHFFATRIGRLGGQMKEKYGTLRFYAQFSSLTLHNLIYPSYVYSQFPKWLWIFDLRVVYQITRYTGLTLVFQAWQRFWYKFGYRYILKKYPHIRKEIGQGADYPELFAYRIVEVINFKEKTKTTRYLDKDGTVLAGWISSL